MATLSSANAKYTAEQLAKASGISTETLATWGLTEATDTLTISQLAEMASSDAQAKTVLDKIIAQNAQAVANGEVTASNIALTTSETGTTLATGAFTTAIKANISAMKTWLLTTPAGWLTMLVGGIFLAVKAYDALTVSVEEQKEKMEDSLSAYEDAKSELSNITSELESQEKAMDDLLKKDKLTYAEKGQLEELQAITQELRIQKDLAEEEEGRTKKEVATDASDLFNKQFGKYDISEDAINEYQNNADTTGNNSILISDKNDISAMIAGYKQFNELLDEAYGEGNQENIDHFKSLTDVLRDSIFSTAKDLQEQQDNISDYYNIIKNTPYEDLTTEQKEVVDSYNAISNAITLIYKQLKPDTWNSMQIDNLFATDGIEKTKEELIEMAKEGTLDENVIKSYSKLNSTLEDSNMVLSDGQSAASALCDELYALADAEKSVNNSGFSNEMPVSLNISSTVDQLNTQLKPAMDSLKSAWQDIFTDDGFALEDIDLLSTVDSIKSKLDDLNEIEGITVDYSAFENFVRILEDTESTEQDVKDGFNELATSITDAALSGTEDFKTLKDVLKDLGVINNELVAFDALISNTEALKESGLDLANATDAQIASFANEMVSAENVSKAIAMLTYQKELCGLQDMNTANEVANLRTLAENAGYTGEVIQYLTELEQIYQAVASGVYGTNTQQVAMAQERARQLQTLITESASKVNYEPKVDFSGATKSAGKAGGDAGDAYLEAFQQELSDLQDLRDRGVIDEAEYLNRLRALYIRYFADRKEYLDEFNKYERQYLEGMKSLYDSALSGISKLLSNKIDAAQEGKEAAISALEEEKEAAADAYQAQIDALEEQISAIDDIIDEKNKQIDSINKEIDAIQKANDERERQLKLQKALYNLERMQNQRTILQYSEDKGMHYVQDTSGVRDAKNEVENIQTEMQIAELEKQIDLIQEEIDLLEEQKEDLQDQQEAIQKMLDASNEYYDKLIKQQEKMWDSMIKNLENQKSKWEELANIQEIAEAHSAIEQVFGELGYSVEDVLNGSESAFEDFKSKYLAIMSDMNQNTSFQEGLEYASGVAKESFGSIVNDSKDVKDALTDIGSTSSELEPVAKAIENIGTSSSTASASTSQIADDMSTLNTNTTGLSDNLTGISKALSNMPEASKFDAIAESFSKLAEAIGEVANTLGVGTEGTVGGLLQALTDISEISLGGEDGQGTGIISQFNNLKTAVEGVSSAISGGGSTGASDGASTSSSPSMSAGATEGGTGGLTGAIDAMKKATDEALGSGSGEDAEGEGTGAIGQFDQLKQAVDDVTTAIGSSEDGGNTAEEDAANLIGAIDNLGTKTEEILVGGEDGGESGGVIGRFTEFKDVIGEANEHVTGISEGLAAIDGQEVECTIKVNIETTGGLPVGLAKSTGTALDAMNLESAEYNAKYGKAHAEGTALVSGNWAVQSNEKQALLGELGYEIIVRNGRFFTVGENGAEMFPIKKGDIVFNHEQSEQLLKNGHISGRGKAYADGNVGNTPIISIPDTFVLGRDGFEGMAGINLFNDFINSVATPMTSIDKNVDSISKNISNVNNNRTQSFSVGDITVHCAGITSADVAKEVGTALEKEFSGMANKAYQRASITR